jgi:hypothetical protein
MTKRKVFWRPAELEAVTEELARMGVNPTAYGMEGHIATAQARVLPIDRRRAVNSAVSQLVRKEMLRAIPPPPAMGPEAEGAFIGRHDIEVPTAPAPEPVSLSLDGAARLLGRRIARVLMEALREEIAEQVEALSHGLIETWVEQAVKPVAARTKAPAKPTVLVAGLLPSQAGLISSEFGHLFDLRFFEASGNLQQLKAMSRVDHAFTFTGKISHGVEEAIQAKGTPVLRCPGGMTMLRQKLTELAQKVRAEA